MAENRKLSASLNSSRVADSMSETLDSRRQAETIRSSPVTSGSRLIRFRSACTFRIIVSKHVRRLVFLNGCEPSPEISACLQEAFHRHFRGHRDGGRLVTPEFASDSATAERYLNHLHGLAKDYFSSEHPLPCQPFGKYTFHFETLTSAQLDALDAESDSSQVAAKQAAMDEMTGMSPGWFRELESSPTLRQSLASLIGLHRLAAQADPPVETLQEVQSLLHRLRLDCGRLLSTIFSRWAGRQWDDFPTSRTIASLMDAAASSLRLRFRIVDKMGVERLATLRCAQTGRDRKPAFQYEFASDGIQRVPRASRTLLPADLQPAPADPRRRSAV